MKARGARSLLAALSKALRAARPGFEVRLGAGAPAESLLAFRRAIGVALPEAFDALYRWHDGTRADAGYPRNLIAGLTLSSLDEVLRDKQSFDQVQAQGHFAGWEAGEWWNPAWVPFLTDHSRARWCLDTAGTFGGRPGQIVKWMKDTNERPILFPSIEAWLEVLLATTRAGLWSESPEQGWWIDDARRNEERGIVESICPGYPRRTGARRVAAPPLPPAQVEGTALSLVARYRVPGGRAVHALALARDGGALLVGMAAGDPAQAVLDARSGAVRESLPGTGAVRAVGFALGEAALLYVEDGRDLELRLWWPQPDGVSIETLGRCGPRVHVPFDVSADGERVVWVSDAVRALDVRTGATVLELPAGEEPSKTMAALSADASRVAVAIGGRVVVHGSDGTLQREWETPLAEIGRLRFSGGGRDLFAVGADNRGLLGWDLSTGERIRPRLLSEDARFVRDAASTSDGRWIFRGNSTGDIWVCDRVTGKLAGHDDVHGRLANLCLSADERFLVSGGDDGVIAVRAILPKE